MAMLKFDKKIRFTQPITFLRFFDKNKHNISRSLVIPPKLGKKGFGAIEVELKNSILNEE